MHIYSPMQISLLMCYNCFWLHTAVKYCESASCVTAFVFNLLNEKNWTYCYVRLDTTWVSYGFLLSVHVSCSRVGLNRLPNSVSFEEISPCDEKPWSSSAWAGSRTQRSAGWTEQSRQSSEPAQARIFIFYSAYRGIVDATLPHHTI